MPGEITITRAFNVLKMWRNGAAQPLAVFNTEQQAAYFEEIINQLPETAKTALYENILFVQAAPKGGEIP